MNRWILLYTWLTLLPVAEAASSAWSLRVWQSDGLPDPVVRSLAQTADGYLWVATRGGLARFDGVRFEEIFSPDLPRGSELKVTAMVARGKGGLWLGMDRGLILRVESGTPRIFAQNLPDVPVKEIIEDGDEILWAALRDGTVWRLDHGKVQPFTVADGWPEGESPTSFAKDNQGQIWFSKGGAVGRIRDGRFKTLARFSDQDIANRRLARAADGGVWIWTGSELLKLQEGQELRSFGRLGINRRRGSSNAIVQDRNGAVWTGSPWDGLFRFDGGKFESVPTSHRNILSLAEDREGNLWVGTDGGGLNRVRPRVLDLETGSAVGAIESICEDRHGGMWGVTNRGQVARRIGDQWSVMPPEAGDPRGSANALAADASGGVWIGTSSQSLHCWRDGHYTKWRASDGVLIHTIYKIYVSQSGDVWIAGESPDSIQRFRDGRFRRLELPPDIHGIRAITEDAAGNTWIGAAKGKMLRIVGDDVFDESRLVPSNQQIRCLHATSDGSVWIGYSRGGMARLKDSHFTPITVQQGLRDESIPMILSDGFGYLWFGADSGIFKIRQQEIDDLANGRIARIQPVRYGGEEEGVPRLQASAEGSVEAVRSHDGRLWIPMGPTLVVVAPEKPSDSPQPVPVFVKRVLVDEQIVASSAGGALRLPPSHRKVDFEFTALSFRAPQNVSFRYQVEGLDNDWIEAGAQRVATYQRLPVGNYTFRVKACDSDGVWNERGTELAFTVVPAVWQTWWFRVAAGMMFTVGVAAAARHFAWSKMKRRLERLEREQAVERERTRIARDIHDGLGANLTKMGMLLEDARRDVNATSGTLGEDLRNLTDTAKDMVRTLDETVWAVDPRSDTLNSLADYLFQYTHELFRGTSVRYRMEMPEHFPHIPLFAEFRHHLFLAVKEALNNILKHAVATEVHVSLRLEGEILRIGIGDNGKGFSPEKNSGVHYGLENMRQRLDAIDGTWHLSAREGQGTMIEMQVDIPKSKKQPPRPPPEAHV